MIELFIVFVSLIFGLLLFNIINNKKISVFSTFIFIICVLYYLIKQFDPKYYEDLVNGINKIELYMTIFSSFGFLIAIFEYIIGSKKKSKKEIIKERVIDDNVLTSKDVNTKLDELLVYIELMDEPLACLVNGEYLLNNKMKKVLKYQDFCIDKFKLYSYINTNDKGSMTGDNFSVFRFNGDDTKWYEESKVKINNNEYCLIRQAKNTSSNKIKLKTFKELNNILLNYKKEEKNYFLIFFNITNSLDISNFYGKDFTDLVISKYLGDINNLPYILNTQIFYISALEYVILLDSKTEYNILLSELENRSSIITKSEIVINENKVIVKAKVGCVASSAVEDKNVSNVISKGFDTLKLACSYNYTLDYAIYHKIDDEIDYSASELNIDLDIDLDKYKSKLR